MKKLSACLLTLFMIINMNVSTIFAESNSQETRLVTFGNYEQDANLDNGKEPMEWYAIDSPDGKKTLLISVNCISASHGDGGEWKTSDMREWLNEDFYKAAFSKKEKKRILTTENSSSSQSISVDIQNEKTSVTTLSEEMTEDRVFILSVNGVNANLDQRKYRKTDLTPYAQYERDMILWEAYDRLFEEPNINDYSYQSSGFAIRNSIEANNSDFHRGVLTYDPTIDGISVFFGATPFVGLPIRPCIFIRKN